MKFSVTLGLRQSPSLTPVKKYDDWAQEEFGEAGLNDERLNREGF